MEISYSSIPVFLINRKDCKDRLQSSLQELEKTGFQTIHRVDAFNPQQAREQKANYFSASVYKNIVHGPTNTNTIPTWSAAACAMSHVRAWKMAIQEKSAEQVIIFCEDDIEIQNPELAQMFIAEAYFALEKNPYGIYFFGAAQKYIYSDIIWSGGNYYNDVFNSSTVSQQKTFYPIYSGSSFSFIGSHFYMTTKSALTRMCKEFYPIQYQMDIHISKVMRDRIGISLMNTGIECGIRQNKKRFLTTVQYMAHKNPRVLWIIFNKSLPIDACEMICRFSKVF